MTWLLVVHMQIQLAGRSCAFLLVAFCYVSFQRGWQICLQQKDELRYDKIVKRFDSLANTTSAMLFAGVLLLLSANSLQGSDGLRITHPCLSFDCLLH